MIHDINLLAFQDGKVLAGYHSDMVKLNSFVSGGKHI